jgi:ribosomal protein S18 acetylase RimI-like enzyme
MIIRQAKKSDNKKVIDLYRKELNLEKKFDKFSLPNRILKEVTKDINKKNNIVYVAEDNKKIIGFTHGIIKKTKFSKLKKVGICSVCYIKKSFRRKGIGRKLTNILLKRFKSKRIKHVYLTVTSKNKIAVKCWRSLGFKELNETLWKKL